MLVIDGAPMDRARASSRSAASAEAAWEQMEAARSKNSFEAAY